MEKDTFDYDAALRELEIDPTDDGDNSAILAKILLASMRVGCNARLVADELQITMPEVKRFESRLWDQKIWTEFGVDDEKWQDEDGGTISFMMDLLCATGSMDRSWSAETKEWRYIMTPAGNAKVEGLLKPAPKS